MFTTGLKSDGSIHLLSRPELMIPKCTSFSSVESDQSDSHGSRSGMLTRAGTMSESALHRKESGRTTSRPKSEIPLGVGGRELEASFEVSYRVSIKLAGDISKKIIK